MAWYFNFCAPALPNDPTINFHRGFQVAQMMTLLILFILYHMYYKLCVTDSGPQEDNSNQNSSKSSQQSKSQSEESQNKSQAEENKSVSIAEKINIGQQNQSYISFKSSGDKFLKKHKTVTVTEPTPAKLKFPINAKQIQSYFPIVYGHHAIAMAASVMYSPYAEQSIAAILYVLFSFLLAIVNAKRMRKSTNAVWIVMAFLNVFIMMSALLEVGQSNWDFVNNVCFAEEYVALY